MIKFKLHSPIEGFVPISGLLNRTFQEIHIIYIYFLSFISIVSSHFIFIINFKTVDPREVSLGWITRQIYKYKIHSKNNA